MAAMAGGDVSVSWSPSPGPLMLSDSDTKYTFWPRDPVIDGETDGDPERVCVGVPVGVGVPYAVFVGDCVTDGVPVGVVVKRCETVEVTLGVTVCVDESDGDGVCVAVSVGEQTALMALSAYAPKPAPPCHTPALWTSVAAVPASGREGDAARCGSLGPPGPPRPAYLAARIRTPAAAAAAPRWC